MKKFLFLLLLWSTQLFAYQLQTSKGIVDVNYDNIEGVKATYGVTLADYVPVATATDMVCLVASSTKTIKLTYLQVSGDSGSSSTQDLYVYKRTALNTGGTFTNPTITKYDTNDAASNASVRSYSANASALGAGTIIRGIHMSVPSSNTPQLTVVPTTWELGNRAAKAPTLKAGSTEQLCISWNGNAVPASTALYINLEWTEE